MISASHSHSTYDVHSMEGVVAALVKEEKTRFPEPLPWKFDYGTAGFRDKSVNQGTELDRDKLSILSTCTNSSLVNV